MSTDLRLVYRLTNSQRMALLDILSEVMRCPAHEHHTENFFDCSTSPVTETHFMDLFNLFSDTSEMEVG